MVEVSPPTGPGAERAACTLAALQREAASVRAQLLALQGDLAQVQGHFNAARATQLLEANEQLVLAALRAESIADTASGKLDELRAPAQRDALTGTPNRALMLDLREANAQLVVATLAAQATELDAEQAHCRQLDLLRRLAQQMRQPLAPIQAAVARLDSVRDDPAHSTQLQTGIQHHLEHLARLLQDLLSGIRAGSGAFRLDRGAVEPAEVHLRRTHSEHRPGPGARLRRRAWR